MDKIEEQIDNLLFDVFGLCPEYKVTRTDLEWVEIYKEPNYDEPPNDFLELEKVRLRLNEHKAFQDNGLWVSAHFAVYHPGKTIYFRITELEGQKMYYKVSTNE